MPAQPTVLAFSERVYRMLLAAYPAEFRERYAPEMAQVFRTSCRLAYRVSGASGVARLWPAILWDWAGSAMGEWFSNPFRRSKVYHIHTGRAASQLIPMLFFLMVCLICLFITPCAWVLGDPLFAEYCWFEVDNASGKTLRVTPIHTDHNSYTAVRLYRETFPFFPAYQQRNITVKSAQQVYLSYSCDGQGVSELYACDLDGECYVHQHAHYGYAVGQIFTFISLESLNRPDAALEAAVQTFPEHNDSVLRNVLLCFTQVLFLIGGIFWLVRSRVVEIPKHDI